MSAVAAVLFDLDETLIEEHAVVAEAFAATAAVAAGRHDIDPERLAAAAQTRARELWHEAPHYDWCADIGISSWEGLYCTFEGDGAELVALRDWSPAFRRDAWGRALADEGVDDPELASELAERYATERSGRHRCYVDAEPVLQRLGATYLLGLVTNGASCLQRAKLEASGLGGHFRAVVVSAEAGAGKPAAAPFLRALAALGVAPEHAVMVGDNLERDVAGAEAAGLGAVWLDRRGRTRPDGATIASLAELPDRLAAW